MEREFFKIRIETSFTASHQLKFADGTREELHSHKWMVRAAVISDHLDKMGLAIDFDRLKAMVTFVISPFEGAQLENSEAFKEINSSAENVAKYIYKNLEAMLGPDVQLAYTEVMEAPGCWARYYNTQG